MSILLDWLPPYSHYSDWLLQFGFKPWSIWILLKRELCHTGFFNQSSTNAAFEWNKGKWKKLYDRPDTFMPVQDFVRGGFLWEPQDQRCFQSNTPFPLEYWLRIILPFLANARRGVSVVHRESIDCWGGGRNRSAELFHTTVLIHVSELHALWRFTEYLFPFFLYPHTPVGTWLNNDYGIDAGIWLKSSMASVMEEGGQAAAL